MSVDIPDTFRRAELAPLWDAARDRLERTGLTPTSTPLRLRALSDAEVDAICGLLGRRRPAGATMSIRLDRLDEALVAGAVGVGLVAVLEMLGGPLVDRRAVRARRVEARSSLWDGATAHASGLGVDLVAWVEALRRRGTVTRLALDDPLPVVVEALDIVDLLVAGSHQREGEPLPVVAALLTGDAHALDPDRPLGSLVADGVAFLGDDEADPWGGMGIDVDLLTVTALTLGLPGVDGTIAASAAAVGEPLRVTHRMLDRGFGLDVAALVEEGLGAVWVCENPAIVRLAADRIGPRCSPLICTEGQPNRAVRRLFGLMRAAGVELRVHADFDAGGVAILGGIVAAFDAVPWRMGTADYLEALEGPSLSLHTAPAATPWEPSLATSMAAHGRAVHEEAIAETLLADLTLPTR